MQQDKSDTYDIYTTNCAGISCQRFCVTTILADGGFECVRNNLVEVGISLNVTSRNEHLPKVEIYIRIVKERVRAIAVFKK